MVNEPSWHKLENAVLESSPANWEDARSAAGLTWEVEKHPVGVLHSDPDSYSYTVEHAGDWQAITRDDTQAVLSIQPKTYRVVTNKEFGGVIDTLLGIEKTEHVIFEALMSLYGGRQIVALAYFEEPLKIPWDESQTYTYIAFSSRHDGQGGVRGIPTNVRVQCANTLSAAEALGKNTAFSIRHSSNFEERVADIGNQLKAARMNSQEWLEGMQALALWSATPRDVDVFLQKMFPVSDDMTQRVMDNRLINRSEVRNIYERSETTESIRGNGYGLLMATTEWADHVRPSRSSDAEVSRSLLLPSDPKFRASKILSSMAS